MKKVKLTKSPHYTSRREERNLEVSHNKIAKILIDQPVGKYFISGENDVVVVVKRLKGSAILVTIFTENNIEDKAKRENVKLLKLVNVAHGNSEERMAQLLNKFNN